MEPQKSSELKDLAEVTVDRSRWRTGSHGKGQIILLNEEGFRCCLGFWCNQAGLSDEDIFRQGCPGSTKKLIPKLTSVELVAGCPTIKQTVFASRATQINDSQDLGLTDEMREQKLIALGKENGVLFRFVGKYINH